MNDIINLINSVGFPIMACIYLAENNKRLTTLIGDLNVTLKSIEKTLDMKEDKNE